MNKKKSLSDRLERARLVIDGALADPALIKQTAPFGFDRKALQQARILYDEALRLQLSKVGELGAQRDSTLALRDAKDAAHQLYMKHVKIVRMAVPREEELWKKLGLSGKRETTLTGWITQVGQFYQHVALVQETLEQFNVQPAELQQAQAMVKAVAEMRVQQNHRKSQSQQLRERRDESLQQLEKWVGNFLKVARIAFEDNPQQLEALGLVVASGQ